MAEVRPLNRSSGGLISAEGVLRALMNSDLSKVAAFGWNAIQ